MNLSEHFTLAEMAVSQWAARRGIANAPGPAEIAALRALCGNVLEVVRSHYGRPVIVTSGFRSFRVNSAIGGVASSQHTRGEAADFTVPGTANIDVCQWMQRHLHYDQIIYEYGPGGWIHVSWRDGRNRNMELTKKHGVPGYLPGIVA